MPQLISHHCENCNKELLLYPSQAKTRRFCSTVCRSQFASKKYPPKNCRNCGKAFHDKTAIRHTPRRLYCSRKCYTEHTKASLRNCLACGKLFKVTPGTEDGAFERVHCSRACRRSANSIRMFGSIMPNPGRCVLCETAVSEERLLCGSCHRRRQARREKQLAINAYGGKCACCGEANLAFLTLDHINDDGGEHRKRMSEKNGYHLGGAGMYRALRMDGYPSGLQVLCWNCNCAKQFYGGCPHKDTSRDFLLLHLLGKTQVTS